MRIIIFQLQNRLLHIFLYWQWTDEPLPQMLISSKYPEQKTHRELKEQLYYDVVKNFDQGKVRTMRCCCLYLSIPDEQSKNEIVLSILLLVSSLIVFPVFTNLCELLIIELSILQTKMVNYPLLLWVSATHPFSS